MAKKEYMKDYTRQKCQMEHSVKKLSKVCIQEHKQNGKILNMRNTPKEDMQIVQTEAGYHTYMASTQKPKTSPKKDI